jgi:hypothetical protein
LAPSIGSILLLLIYRALAGEKVAGERRTDRARHAEGLHLAAAR